MANNDFSVRHIDKKANLPETLVQGRVYFIDDEGSLVVNHGSGAITYGSKKKTDANTEAIGDITGLATTAKNSLTAAVNELVSTINTRLSWAEDNK